MSLETFLEALRRGAVPTREEINTFFQIPLVYQLRESLGDDDLQWVWQLARNPEVRTDTVSLLTGWAQHQEVWEWMLEEWGLVSTYEWKQGLLWVLTENPDFDDKDRRAAASWLVSNLGPYLTTCARWWGTPAERLGRAISSLEHRGRPRKKAFMYLCVAMGASNRNGLRELLTRYAADSIADQVGADVAQRLLTLVDAAEAPL